MDQTTFLIFVIGLPAFIYFFSIRPQRKRMKAQRELSQSVEAGDEIRTIGGIHGRVVSAYEDSVVLAVEDGRIRVSRRAIGSRVGDEE